ncbi:spore germination protein GerPE [Paenibacillus harenae]|uniref:Spore germination protein PE n=1 Tax=Paenibacillus harenae TaxID=306543 RepID=A0ABT9TWD3_PAEHA|nr:spore germination protein GerPE [Paenibacillus harenae]MDQ0111673.1 spore germination protein PE [Paenibacillus harenae]
MQNKLYPDDTHPIRTARIGAVCLIDVSSSGAVQFGDRGETNAKLRAIALQRQEDHTTAGDVFYESYRIFDRDLPELVDPEYADGQGVHIERVNADPFITVGYIHVTATGAASSLLCGNCMRVNSESRIMHIRQYPRPRPIPGAFC